LKAVLASFARRCSFAWRLPPGTDPRNPLDRVCHGGIDWNIDALEFFNLGDEDWREKLGFQAAGNGDWLAIDGLDDVNQPVVHLLHDGPYAWAGYELGAEFIDFLDRSSALGCPAPNSNWRCFAPTRLSLLQPGGEQGRTWREWLQLP
jgi:hypothetical protein